jgi:signal transduction histidine kinase
MMYLNSLVTPQPQNHAVCYANDFHESFEGSGNPAPLPSPSLGNPHRKSAPPVDERLAERMRIARELHDTLLQGFLAASMQLHAAVESLNPNCAEKKQFDRAIELVEGAIEEGRCAIQGLRSPQIESASLTEALARVPGDLGFPSDAGFRIVVLGTEKNLRAGLLEEIYRIGREAIANACRHSQAKAIEMEVEYRPTELRIAVRDNGRGIASQDLQWERNGHWGLRGMRERAERIGARLHLWSNAALGTEVELCVPAGIAFDQADA